MQAADSLMVPFPVGYTVPPDVDYLLNQEFAADLATPSNITTVPEYDPVTGVYVVRTRVGDMEVATPFILTPQQYNDWQMRQSMLDYYRQRNAEELDESKKKPFNIFDMNFALGPLEKIFGPGGVNLKLNGNMQINMGISSQYNGDPSRSKRHQRTTRFDFDQKIQATVNATVGNRMSFNMSYNTDATFDFDSKNLKLAYKGEEDDIVKEIEAGNVSMTTGGTLIRGATALFGLKTKLQFGKLTATALVAQQNSASKSVSTEGGAQTTEFMVKAHDYDSDRHYFLGLYFYDHYNEFAANLPLTTSGVEINNVEVWVTNRTGNYNNSRDIIAFTDLGESITSNLQNPTQVHVTGGNDGKRPSNNNNDLYASVKDIENFNGAEQILSARGLVSGNDYMKVEKARLLSSGEYTVNKQLGYISLRSQLRDEVLGISYEYTYNGTTYYVGTMSSSVQETERPLMVKMLKSVQSNSDMKTWKLMMRNVYNTGGYSLVRDHFKLDVKFLNQTNGNVEQIYLPLSGTIGQTPLLQLLGLDRLNSTNQSPSDGFFDWLDGYTVLPQTGRIIFPVTEPFGEYLAEQIMRSGFSRAEADKYCYYDLYTKLQSENIETENSNVFTLQGRMQAATGNTIRLNATNVPRGSVVVTAGGTKLIENTDYTVDYSMGLVTILNQSIIDSGQNISVSLEDQGMNMLQKRTLLGLDLQYQFNRDFSVGATVMHYSEKTQRQKISISDNVVNNTIWGFNFDYNTRFNWLTSLLNKIPTVNATQPSTLNLKGEFAQIIPHTVKSGNNNGSVYIDDFDTSSSALSLAYPSAWQIGSAPYERTIADEAGNIPSDLETGFQRAMLNWNIIDQLFINERTSGAPRNISGNKVILENPYVRQIKKLELFPGSADYVNDIDYINTFNFSFYPLERGPYNVNPDYYRQDILGFRSNPVTSEQSASVRELAQKSWGTAMRKLDTTNFDQNNIEYLEFWLMDPFMDYAPQNFVAASREGTMKIQLGDISEDILKDGRKSYENGIPYGGADSPLDETVWGYVPARSSMGYAFADNNDSRPVQDVGLDALSDAQEQQFPTYSDFINKVSAQSPDQATMDSVLRDPANDDYHYYLGDDYDDEGLDILQRYKRYNGLEYNSLARNNPEAPAQYQAYKNTPDAEDINGDGTMNESNNYYQYEIDLSDLRQEGNKGRITETRTYTITYDDLTTQEVTWYHFIIPIKQPDSQVGSISNFANLRFMRMQLEGFDNTVHMRLANFQFVRGTWRMYDKNLEDPTNPPTSQMSTEALSLFNNSDSEPINYVLPPGVTQEQEANSTSAQQLNEGSLSFTVKDLEPGAARAIYKSTSLDVRNYKSMQLWVHGHHAQSTVQGSIEPNSLEVFIRLGSDAYNNFYEVAKPLVLTPVGPSYNNQSLSDREAVWPNYFDFELQDLVNLKRSRNRAHFDTSKVYTEPSDDNRDRKLRVKGNPSIGNIQTLMIGVRNVRTGKIDNVTVWVNELRVSDFTNSGGWAAKIDATIGLSDIARVQFGGHIETDGFGSVDQGLNSRRLDKYEKYNVTVEGDLHRFVPEKAKLNAPIYYSYSMERTTPKYNPLDNDVKVSDAVEDATTQEEKDFIEGYSVTRTVNQNFAMSEWKFDRRSEVPKPWDPANFVANFSFRKKTHHDPTTDHEYNNDYSGGLTYTYSPYAKGVKPFGFIKSKNRNLRFVRDWELFYFPRTIMLSTVMTRHYEETQQRAEFNYDHPELTPTMPAYAAKDFYWNRRLNLAWKLTNSLEFTINTQTRARIEETEGVVNRTLFPDRYKEWRDTVWNSILRLGTPWGYNQEFVATYKAPFNKIPVLDMLNASADYRGTYNWDRATIVGDRSSGNRIQNEGTWTVNGSLQFDNIYTKFAYLKEINKRFANTRNNRNQPEKKPRKYERTFSLRPDTTLTIRHNLRTKKVNVVAVKADGTPFEIRTKVIDPNTIEVLTHGSESLKFTVNEVLKTDKTFWTELLAYSTRLLMSPRNLRVVWKHGNRSEIPMFIPNAGDVFGQNLTYGPMAPGMAFAFGMTDEGFLNDALDRGWLMRDETLNSPAMFTKNDNLTIELNLELFKGFKVRLTGARSHDQVSNIQFGTSNLMTTYSGRYTKSHVAIATALRSYSASDNYRSDAFDKMCDYVAIMQRRYDAQYQGTNYPQTGVFAHGQPANDQAGKPFDPANGVSPTSSDVLIPAFIAAYTGTNPEKQYLDIFPSIAQILPNWTITYDGLINLGNMRNIFKSFTISHAYQCSYEVGSYASHGTWESAGMGGNLGFLYNETTGLVLPSSPYNVQSVSINERFNPLIRVAATLNNNLNFSVQWADTRNLTLNTSAGQVVENLSRRIGVSAGYVINNFNSVLKLGKKQTGFNNDLTLQGEFSYQVTQALIRTIQSRFTQGTNGARTVDLNIIAKYAVSRLLSFGGYFRHQIHTPIVSTNAFPTSTTDFGFTFDISLAQ